VALHVYIFHNSINAVGGQAFHLQNVNLAFLFMLLCCFQSLSGSDTRKMIRMYGSADLLICCWRLQTDLRERERERGIMFRLGSSAMKREEVSQWCVTVIQQWFVTTNSGLWFGLFFSSSLHLPRLKRNP